MQGQFKTGEFDKASFYNVSFFKAGLNMVSRYFVKILNKVSLTNEFL